MSRIAHLKQQYEHCLDQSIKHHRLGNDTYELAWDNSAIQLLREIEQLKDTIIIDRRIKDYGKI